MNLRRKTIKLLKFLQIWIVICHKKEKQYDSKYILKNHYDNYKYQILYKILFRSL